MKKHVIVRADAFAGVGAAAANASLEWYLIRAMMYFQAVIGAAGFLELGGDVTAHAAMLSSGSPMNLLATAFEQHESWLHVAYLDIQRTQALDTWSLGVQFAALRI